MRPRRSAPPVIVVGPVPPPAHGVAVATALTLASPLLRARFSLYHLDTSDRRGLGTIGRFDVANVALALLHTGRCWRLARRLRPVLVYLPLSQGPAGLLRDWALIGAARLAGARYVVHLHGGGYDRFFRAAAPPVRRMLGDVLRGAEAAVVLGDSLVPMVAAIAPDARVAVVPNGAPPAIGDAERPRRGGDGPVRVLYLSGLRPSKGIFELLEAAARLHGEGAPAAFVVAGAWDEEAERLRAERFVRERGLAGVVTFTGPVSGAAKAEAYRSADVFVLPSHAEGQPFVVLEALSAWLPVVASDTGVIPDMVRDGVNGYVVPPKDVDALTARLRDLVADPALRAAFGDESRRLYLERFSLEQSQRLLADVFAAAT